MALLHQLRHLINLSHALAWDDAVRSPSKYNTPDEPGLVAALLDSRIQDGLEGELRKALGATANVQVDSIFTHKTPLVKPCGVTPVEIGDLLLIRQHFVTGTAIVQGMALLLQAKKNIQPSSGDISSGKPNIQFELYRDWPSFHGETRLEYTPDPFSSPPQPWDFKLTNPLGRFGEYVAVFGDQAHGLNPPAALGAATAAFSVSHYPPMRPAGHPKTAWSSGQVSPTAAPTEVACPKDFAETLEQFFHGNAGEPFVPGVMRGTDHWSRFVNTMLGEAAKTDYTFLSRRTNVTANTPRGAQICTFMAIQPLVKLAIMREVHQYLPYTTMHGLPNFRHEPHFYHLAISRSGFVEDLAQMEASLRVAIGAGDAPPRHPEEPALPRQNSGYHVPILSIATSGSLPLWESREMPRI